MCHTPAYRLLGMTPIIIYHYVKKAGILYMNTTLQKSLAEYIDQLFQRMLLFKVDDSFHNVP